MKKLFKILIPLILLIVVFSPVSVALITESKESGPQITTVTVVLNTTYAQERNTDPLQGLSDLTCPDFTDSGGIICILQKAIALLLLRIGNAFVFITGVFMNYMIQYTVVDMADNITKLGVINSAWAALRDLANIIFIFILIYLAIGTILSLSTRATRQSVVRIIIVALLINFSLFFTKVIIDTSNIVALQFFNAIARSDENVLNANSGISMSIQQGLFLNSIYNLQAVVNAKNCAAANSTPHPSPVDVERCAQTGIAGNTTLAKELADDGTLILIGVFGFIFMIITAFVFFTIALMLLTRFVVLIILMITAALAYVLSALPKGSGYASRWWDSLIQQCIFAPVMMMFLWFLVYLTHSDGYQHLFGSTLDPTQAASSGASLASLSASGKAGAVAILMNFLVIIGIAVAGLTIARQAGVSGARWSLNQLKNISKGTGKYTGMAAGGAVFGGTSWVGRNTVGRAADSMATAFKNTRFATTSFGKAVTQASRAVGKANFDVRSAPIIGKTAESIAKQVGTTLGKPVGKGGYTATIDTEVKNRVDYAKSLGKEPVFIDKQMEDRYKDLQRRNTGDRDELSKVEAEVLKLNAKGSLTPVEESQRSALMDTQKKIKVSVDQRDAELKAIVSNKNIAIAPQEAYAKTLESPSNSLVGMFTTYIPVKDRRAAKKIREDIKKNPVKDLRKAMKEARIEDEEPTAPATGTTTPGTGTSSGTATA